MTSQWIRPVAGISSWERNECPSRWVEPMWNPNAPLEPDIITPEVSERGQSAAPWVLLVDDGDMNDVDRFLTDLGTPTLRLIGRAVNDAWQTPRRLLIMTGRRAVTLGHPISRSGDGFASLAVLSDPSKTQRDRVRNMGFDYLVRRPVDPEALRLLIRSELYGGHEQRSERRFPVGWPIALRTRWRKRSAQLVEISRWGCSLRTARVDAGPEIEIRLPANLTGTEGLSVRGRMCRCEHAPGQAMPLISVVFDRKRHSRKRLGEVLAGLRTGPPTLL